MHQIPYEGSDLISVHATKESAMKRIKVESEESYGSYKLDSLGEQCENKWDCRYYIVEQYVVD